MGRGKRRVPLSAESAPSRVPGALSASLTAPLPDDRLERLSTSLRFDETLKLEGQRFLGLVASQDWQGDPFCYAWIEAASWEDFCAQVAAQAGNSDDPNPLPNYVIEISSDPLEELRLEALDYDVVDGLERGEALEADEATPQRLLEHLIEYGYAGS
jgi:hypothetical protein